MTGATLHEMLKGAFKKRLELVPALHAARGHYNLSYHCRSHARASPVGRDGEDAFDDDDDDLGAVHWCTNALKFEVR